MSREPARYPNEPERAEPSRANSTHYPALGATHLNISDCIGTIAVDDEPLLVPMRLPDAGHVLDGHALGLGQEEGDEECHDDDASGKEEEHKLEAA